MWLNLYEAVQHAFLVFLGCFWAYAGQPHNHIGWAASMPFASINSTNPTTNPWNFHKKILRIGRAGKLPFFKRPFWFFSFKKKIIIASIQWKDLSQYKRTLEYLTLGTYVYQTNSRLINCRFCQIYNCLAVYFVFFLLFFVHVSKD